MLHMVCPNLKVIQINGNFFRRLALICSRTPHGVRGLKLGVGLKNALGLWCRTPHGVRGLKYRIQCYQYHSNMSHSAWSAWIEISGRASDVLLLVSHSAWSAWIEI